MRLPLTSACTAFLMLLSPTLALAQASTLPIQQQAAKAAALGQGQVPAPAAPAPAAQVAPGAVAPAVDAPAAAAPPTATGAMAAVNAADAAAAATHPGIVPGVSPSTAPPPESKDEVHQPFKRSLFFSAEELIQISQAIKGIIVAPGGDLSNIGKPIPQVRTITLTGVLYKSPDDWLIWLNGQKLNPKFLLKEIVDIQVEKDLVRLKWFDIGLNGVIDVTMRPHQKYDIVTGLMLPVPPGE